MGSNARERNLEPAPAATESERVNEEEHCCSIRWDMTFGVKKSGKRRLKEKVEKEGLGGVQQKRGFWYFFLKEEAREVCLTDCLERRFSLKD